MSSHSVQYRKYAKCSQNFKSNHNEICHSSYFFRKILASELFANSIGFEFTRMENIMPTCLGLMLFEIPAMPDTKQEYKDIC